MAATRPVSVLGRCEQRALSGFFGVFLLRRLESPITKIDLLFSFQSGISYGSHDLRRNITFRLYYKIPYYRCDRDVCGIRVDCRSDRDVDGMA